MKIEKISEDNFEQSVLKSDIPVLVDFYADWCGPCSVMSPIVEDIASELEDKINVGKVNIDENQELAIKYDIMSIPTIILFKNGNIEKSFIGVRSKEEIINAIR